MSHYIDKGAVKVIGFLEAVLAELRTRPDRLTYERTSSGPPM